MVKVWLPPWRTSTSPEGVMEPWMHAVAFAVLANEAIFAGCNNVPTVTGAKNPVVMGQISL